MFCRPLLQLALLLTALPGLELRAVDREITRVFAVEPGCELSLDTHRGEVLVEESEVNEVRVSVGISVVAGSKAVAERLLEATQVELGMSNNRVSIKARSRLESGVRFTWNEDDRVEFVFRISVPRKCDVDLQVAQGGAVVGNLAGRMKVRIEKGSAFFRRIEGSVNARVDFGSLVVSRCSGPVNARVLRGSMRLGTIGGRAELINSTGDIEVMAVRGGIVAEAQAGDIRVGFAPNLANDSRVSVSGGNLIAGFQAKTACRIDGAATWGRVNSTLPLTIEAGASGKRSLVGRLNGGGPLVTLRASGGSVTLEPAVGVLDEDP